MAGRIGVMDAGRLEQVATPRELYEAPRSRWIAEFVGDINLIEGKLETSAEELSDDGAAHCHRNRARPERSTSPSRASRSARPIFASRSVPKRSSCRAGAAGSDDARAINRLEGVVTDVGYLGGIDQLQDQARQRCGAAFGDGQYRAARFRRLWRGPTRGGVVFAGRLRGAGAMSARTIFTRPARLAADRALSVDGAVLSGAVPVRPEDQPVADRDRAAALYAGVRLGRGVGSDSRRHLLRSRSTISGCWFPTTSMSCLTCAALTSRRFRPRSCS